MRKAVQDSTQIKQEAANIQTISGSQQQYSNSPTHTPEQRNQIQERQGQLTASQQQLQYHQAWLQPTEPETQDQSANKRPRPTVTMPFIARLFTMVGIDRGNTQKVLPEGVGELEENSPEQYNRDDVDMDEDTSRMLNPDDPNMPIKQRLYDRSKTDPPKALRHINSTKSIMSNYTDSKKRRGSLNEDIDLKLLIEWRKSHNIKKYIIYPEGKFKSQWDLLQTVLIIITCALTPIFIAFPEQQTKAAQYLDNIMNILFALDMIFNFFTAYYDSDFNIIDDQKMIAWNYMMHWFSIDLLSVIPFEIFYEVGGFNKMARLSRISKVYRLLRLSKIFRLARVAKFKSKFIRHMAEVLKIGQGTERLVQLLILFFALQHLTASIWIFVGKMDDDSKTNWIYSKGMTDAEDLELYVTAFYFTVTTLVTVGYGDITAQSVPEKLMCIVMMMLGVVAFSITTGALSSIISSYDSQEAQLKEKISTLNQIASEYEIDLELFNKLTKTLRYDHSKKTKDYKQFMEELPSKLRMELAHAIHSSMYSTVAFFQGKEKSFIAWVSRHIHPMHFDEDDYIYKEGEEILEIYFLVEGAAGYVLPRFGNKMFFEITQGSLFGQVDLGDDPEFYEEIDSDTSIEVRKRYNRHFTVMALINSQLLALGLIEMKQMSKDFPEPFAEIFKDVRDHLRHQLLLKLEVTKIIEIASTKNAKAVEGGQLQNQMQQKFTVNIIGGLQKEIKENIRSDPYDGTIRKVSTKRKTKNQIGRKSTMNQQFQNQDNLFGGKTRPHLTQMTLKTKRKSSNKAIPEAHYESSQISKEPKSQKQLYGKKVRSSSSSSSESSNSFQSEKGELEGSVSKDDKYLELPSQQTGLFPPIASAKQLDLNFIDPFQRFESTEVGKPISEVVPPTTLQSSDAHLLLQELIMTVRTLTEKVDHLTSEVNSQRNKL
ncbi:hypothetical protein FGO68_gene9701 [Halteria grandinella]|uniref:Cyclic nucleotide-binding domain-containing protein n=1 Tax=Halteria grandinella TaxID=5974 RepID=A0A8J8P4U2_HALGN|nr:hypothetical protein FGO68_gene9701 [Halteria grandinella]